MEPSTTAPPLRALLTEAAALRMRGDHSAAAIVEADAVCVLRASVGTETMEARA